QHVQVRLGAALQRVQRAPVRLELRLPVLADARQVLHQAAQVLERLLLQVAQQRHLPAAVLLEQEVDRADHLGVVQLVEVRQPRAEVRTLLGHLLLHGAHRVGLFPLLQTAAEARVRFGWGRPGTSSSSPAAA
ncbi:unnamed protein product, partial [Heterosigma akashiwo]